MLFPLVLESIILNFEKQLIRQFVALVFISNIYLDKYIRECRMSGLIVEELFCIC